jgi:hypothetical protein
MSLSNTQLAQQASQVLLGHQSFVNQTINWLTSIGPTVRLTDPYNPLVFADVATPQALQAQVDALTGQAGSAIADATVLLNQATSLLADASDAADTFEGYNTTFVGYLTAGQLARDAAQAARDGAETLAGQAQTAATAAGASATTATTAEANASGSASAAAASATAAAASALASSQSALQAAEEADDAETARVAAEAARDAALAAATVGPQGPAGPAGPQGSVGPQGPQGPVGPAGADGADGAAGVDGADAVIRIMGTVASVAALPGSAPEDDAYWVDERTTFQRVRVAVRRSGAWVLGGNLLGPAGEMGPQGPAGLGLGDPNDFPDPNSVSSPLLAILDGTDLYLLQDVGGNLSYAGPISLIGPQGLTGATGPQGPAGATGAAGPQGPQGPQGPIGLTGPAGPVGPAGPPGAGGGGGGSARKVSTQSLTRHGGAYFSSLAPFGFPNGTAISGGSTSVTTFHGLSNAGVAFQVSSAATTANSGGRMTHSGSPSAIMRDPEGIAHTDFTFAIMHNSASVYAGIHAQTAAGVPTAGAYFTKEGTTTRLVMRHNSVDLASVPVTVGLNTVYRLVVINRRTDALPRLSNTNVVNSVLICLSDQNGVVLGVLNWTGSITSWVATGALSNFVAYFDGTPTSAVALAAGPAFFAGADLPPGAEEPVALPSLTVTATPALMDFSTGIWELEVEASWTEANVVGPLYIDRLEIQYVADSYSGQGVPAVPIGQTIRTGITTSGSAHLDYFEVQSNEQAATLEGIQADYDLIFDFRDSEGRTGRYIRRVSVNEPA